jgi:hypothetical protein
MENSNVFRVYVNQVDVGAIPESEYRAIVAEANESVKEDNRLYLAQAINIGGCFIRLAFRVLELSPMVIFLGLVIGTSFTPDLIVDIVTSVRAASASQIVSFMQLLGISSMFIAGFILLMGGNSFGYINQFDNAIASRISLRIREILEVAAEGEVSIEGVGKDSQL